MKTIVNKIILTSAVIVSAENQTVLTKLPKSDIMGQTHAVIYLPINLYLQSTSE